MRVVLTTETFLPKIEGNAKVAALTLDHYQRRGIEAFVLTPDLGLRSYAGVEVIGVPGPRNPFYPDTRIGLTTPGIYQRVRAFKPDIIHIMHPVMTGLAALFYSRWLRIPTVASFHLDLARITSLYGVGFLQRPVNQATTWAFNSANYALAPSRLVQSQLRKQGVRKVGWWKRGVDADHFSPRFRDPDMRAMLSGGHPDDTLLLFVGRVAVEKQLDQVKVVLERVPGTRLAIVGDGPARESLEKHFAGMPVNFVGYLHGEPLARAYASADLFVFPSMFESF